MTDPRRLRWLCRRGMKELDLLLLGYLDRRYAGAPAGEQAAFVRLLSMQDPDILHHIGRAGATGDEALDRVLAELTVRDA